jgi:hypothetical protein
MKSAAATFVCRIGCDAALGGAVSKAPVLIKE